MLLSAILSIFTIRSFNRACTNEENIHWQLEMYYFVVISP